MRIRILGSAAGGGFPQWNCRCPVCQLAWSGDPRVEPRTQSSVAVTADGRSWLLLNASPDLRQQILAAPPLHPREGDRHSPIVGVVVTNGDVDHIAGLLSLRERQPLTIYASEAILDVIRQDAVFRVLDPSVVTTRIVALDSPFAAAGLTITPFAVPGKVPLFLEAGDVEVGGEGEMTVGLDIRHGDSRFCYVPGCAFVTERLRARLDGADLLLFDGTTYTDDEMVRLGLSPKTAARMGHLPMSGAEGSIAALDGLRIGRRIFVHINNTNPVLVDGALERDAAEAAGWDIGRDGMEIAL